MKKKSIVSLFLVVIMVLSLCACGGETNEGEAIKIENTFAGLSEYIVANGEESEIDGESCYTISFELEDSYALGEVDISAITNGSASECETIAVQGSTMNYPGLSKDYATLKINADGSFEFENDFKSTSVHTIFAYKSTANEYTSETELACYKYDGETKKLLETADDPADNNYGRNTSDLNNILDRTAISLNTIGISLDSLGFTSYEPDMDHARKNAALYDKNEELKNKAAAEKTAKNAEPEIGMTKDEVLNGLWGEPDKKNIDEYEWGTHEQWVYDSYGYVYFEDGVVTSISHR